MRLADHFGDRGPGPGHPAGPRVLDSATASARPSGGLSRRAAGHVRHNAVMSDPGAGAPPPGTSWFQRWQVLLAAGLGAVGAVAAAAIGLAKPDPPTGSPATSAPPAQLPPPATSPPPSGPTSPAPVRADLAARCACAAPDRSERRSDNLRESRGRASTDNSIGQDRRLELNFAAVSGRQIIVVGRPKTENSNSSSLWYGCTATSGSQGEWKAVITISPDDKRPIAIEASLPARQDVASVQKLLGTPGRTTLLSNPSVAGLIDQLRRAPVRSDVQTFTPPP